MDYIEAQAFIEFLRDERDRHTDALRECELVHCMNGYGLSREKVRQEAAYVLFVESAGKRHQKDIDGIDTLTRKVKEMFGL